MSTDDTSELLRQIAQLEQRLGELRAQLPERQAADSPTSTTEDELRLLVDRSPYCIHRIDADQKLVSMNLAGLRMMGVDREDEIVGMEYLAAVGDADRPRIARLLDEAYGGRSSEFEFRAVNGRIFKSFFIPLTVVDGRVTQLMGLTQDITELRETLGGLQASEELNRRIMEALPGGLCHVGADGHIVQANAQWLDQFGLTIADLAAAQIDELAARCMHEDGTPCAPGTHPVARALATGEAQAAVTLGSRGPDGEVAWRIYTVAPLQSADGEGLAGALVTSHDITERKRQEEERRQFEVKLLHAQKLESLGVLAGGIAHDFNNLLVGVMGNAGLARKKLAPDSPALEMIERVEHAAEVASELTRQMLAYSGQGQLTKELIDLSAVALEMTELLAASIPKAVRLIRALDRDLPPLSADATQIRQVVMNLVTNAAEAIEGPSGSVTLTTGTRRLGAGEDLEDWSNPDLPPGLYLHLEVRDTGQGMDARTVSRIFDPFFSTKVSGRGLGLSAVLGIVRAHGGALRIRSQVGEGTSFEVLLPSVADEPAPEPPAVAEEGEWKGRGTILVVDDSNTVRTVAQQTLEGLGFEVLTAVDGHDGVSCFAAHADSIDAVLLDLLMPRLTGADALPKLRRIRPDVKVILSSGYAKEHAVSAFTADGSALFLAKPYGPDQLAAAVRQLLGPPTREP